MKNKINYSALIIMLLTIGLLWCVNGIEPEDILVEEEVELVEAEVVNKNLVSLKSFVEDNKTFTLQ